MKKLVLAMFFATVSVFAKVNVVVSILPEETFVKKIGGEHVVVTTMVQPGSEPHSYEPKPSQMKMLSKADVYFAIGVGFEKSWLDKFKAQNPKLSIVDVSKGIKRVKMVGHHHERDNEHEILDPHVWLSPSNAKIIAKNIYDELVKLDSKNRADYEKGYEGLISQIDKTNKEVKNILKSLKPNTKFLIFHPAWGYFAKEYGLIQVPIEQEGKEPKPKELVKLINQARKDKEKVVITEPEFSDKSAKLIAEELGIKVVKFSPLNPDWFDNLINMAKAIAK